MPQFVIEREIPGAGSLSETQIREIGLRSLQTLTEMGPQIPWLHSYVTEDKVYCVYLAQDEESLRRCGDLSLKWILRDEAAGEIFRSRPCRERQ